MVEPLVFILLLIAVALGFLLGRFVRPEWGRGRKESKNTVWLRQSYFEGLNYLLNEQPDAAIDTFVAALEVNSETLETHFALGSLLRRRGEVDRAIRVHQNLLARPSLSLHQQQQVQVELALDYMKSGLLDRAEALFKELLDSDDLAIRGIALERLIDIYRDEKEWESAIGMAEQLCHRKLGRNPGCWRELQAHFSCELAERAMNKQDWPTARQWVEKALGYDRDNVRAHLDLAHIEIAHGEFGQAVKVLNKIPSASPHYVSEALPLLTECYQQLGRFDVLAGQLKELYRQQPSEMLLQRRAEVIAVVEGEAAARAFVLGELPKFPGLAPMADMLNIFECQAGCQVDYQRFAPVLGRALAERALYECRQCGFVGHQLHWCCPSCKNWGAMVAILAYTHPSREPPLAL